MLRLSALALHGSSAPQRPLTTGPAARPWAFRYTVAVATTIVAAVFNGVLWPDFGVRYPLVGFYPAIAVSAWAGGLWPGVVCTALSSLIAAFVWVDPRFSIRVAAKADAVALLIFITIGVVISVLTELSAQRVRLEADARGRAEAAERDLSFELVNLQRLQRLTVTAFRRDSPPQILDDVLATACELLDTPSACVHVCDQDEGRLTLAAQVGLPPELLNALASIRSGVGAIAAAEAVTRRARVVLNAPAGDSVRGASQAIPMITASGKIIGVLTTYSTANIDATDRRLQYLEACVQQAAQALERSRLLQTERIARRTAEQASQLKDRFLSTISHELRTPLNAVLGWADMLRAGHLSALKRDRAVEAIYNNAQRQAQLIGDLLDVSRISAGTLRIEPVELDVMPVLHRAMEVVEPAATAKGIRFSVHGLPVMCRADPGRLQQVLWNLLSNAVKFTPDGGCVHVAVNDDAVGVEIVVRDNGIGIAPQFLPFVFDPFRQGDTSNTASQGGLGLGLSIVKHLVEAHGGTIRAENNSPERGATFIVRIPKLPQALPAAAMNIGDLT